MPLSKTIQHSLVTVLLLVLGWIFWSYVLKQLKGANKLPAWLKHGLGPIGSSIITDGHGKKKYKVAGKHPEGLSSDLRDDEKIFQLERRAIFSKTWLFVTHICTIQKSGDYRTFEIAGFSLVVMLGKDRKFRVFQNVCRHRAYQVAKKERGSTTVLGCKYHGWSYDTKGNLIRAPEFDNVPGFDKSKNSLWEVRSVIEAGLLFVNLDSSGNVDIMNVPSLQTALAIPSPQSLQCTGEWKFDGAFNWKLADFSGLLLDNESQLLTLARAVLFGQTATRLKLGYNAELHQNKSGDILTLRLLPKTATTTVVECCLYSTLPNCAETTLQILEKAIKGALMAIEALQRATLEEDEEYSLVTTCKRQREINRMIIRHAKDEEAMRAEIQPAAQRGFMTAVGKADDEFCRKLDGEGLSSNKTICSAHALGPLDW